MSPFASPASGSKVAIPRLQRPGHTGATPRDRRRVSRACTACRSHKIKCTGDTPRCRHCQVAGRECVYVLPRRDKLRIVTERCVQMAELLNGLRARTGEEDSARIADLLEAVEEDISEMRQTPTSSNPDTDADETRAAGEASRLGSMNSLATESLDLLEENLLRDETARATGFVGKNSEVQWLRSIIQQLEKEESAKATSQSSFPGAVPSRRGSANIGSVEQVTSFSFYLDSDGVDVNPDFLDPYELPSPETVERLLDYYFQTVHEAFPIFSRTVFLDKIGRYLERLKTGTAESNPLSHKWLAILNLVLAIGARYSHLVQASWQGEERDHLSYHARARFLALGPSALTNHPDVNQIQITGLLSFYYISTGQVSRSWVMMGVALRFAFALGLHIRNEDPSTSLFRREMLVRVWWSLYSLERLLSAITGRPSMIVDGCCSVPLPIPVAEDQLTQKAEDAERLRKVPSNTPAASSSTIASSFSTTSMGRLLIPINPNSIPEANPGSFFRAIVQMGLITQNVILTLYSTGTVVRSLGDVQNDIVGFVQRLDQWSASLPPEFDFQTQRLGPSRFSDRHARERMILGLHFCSARILLTRPCLGGLGQIPTDSNVSQAFILRMAKICVEAAKTAADFLPDQPFPLFIYEKGPWWSIVHYLMQAVSIFLLTILHSSTTTQDRAMLSEYSKKLIRWLRTMPDPLAERGYRLSFSTFEAVAGCFLLDVADLQAEDAAIFPRRSEQNVYNAGFTGGLDPFLESQFVARSISGMGVEGGSPVFDAFDPLAPPMESPFEHSYFHLQE
ncbi:hypothetical protein CC78DRAFT_572112 [Lojkania enalia]|uniref:Zn(2)-C6 fungal-type domain-containing protein n=1 Tax=Lojkania enalia TaxID=147567 RepID=A0A9P4K418_9PLEO|nr:hypothetical protein CC78DRAFT_572112 [Didymosphaeria enalia]